VHLALIACVKCHRRPIGIEQACLSEVNAVPQEEDGDR
jgi:hypothetical protein